MSQALEKDLIGKREQLADYIALVDERSTPFVSVCQKSKQLTNTFFEWIVDAYAAPSTTPAVDGTDVAAFSNSTANRARLQNYIHYFRSANMVSSLAQEVAVTPSGNLIGEARRKALVEMKRSMEAAFLGDNEMQADNGAVGYQTRALGTWISNSAQSLNPVPAAYRPASGQIITTATANLSESDLQNMLQSIYDATGLSGDYKFVVGSTLRRRLTDMTTLVSSGSTNTQVGTRTFTATQSSEAITKTVTQYTGDYGTFDVISDNWIGYASGAPEKGRGYVLDLDKITLRYHGMPEIKPLEDQGGGPRFYIRNYSGLEVCNPIGLGQFNP